MKKMTKKVFVLMLGCGALLSTSNAAAITGVTFGGGLGYSYFTGGGVTKVNDPKGMPFNNGNISASGSVGYDYALTSSFSLGVEVGIQYANNTIRGLREASGNDVGMLSIPVFAVAKYYIPHALGMNIFAKAGYAYNDIKGASTSHYEDNPSGDTQDLNIWRPVLAGGVGYQLNQFNIFSEYQYNWLPYSGKSFGVSSISVGLSYTLPAA